MFFLDPYCGSNDEQPKYAPLIWQSLNDPIYLSVQNPDLFSPEHHYCFGTDRRFTEVTHDEVADIASAMQVAREAFLQGFDTILMTCSDSELRSVLGRSKESFPEWIWRDKSRIAQRMREEVRKGNLIFVPTHEDLQACVKAIQEDRQKRPPFSAQQSGQFDPRPATQSMHGKSPRMPPSLDRPSYLRESASLGDALPFEYQSGVQDGEAFDLASQKTKTPNIGAPGTWYSNPGSGQMRLYGDTGAPVIDLDFDHRHNGMIPHAHNWNNGVRDTDDEVVPFSPWNH